MMCNRSMSSLLILAMFDALILGTSSSIAADVQRRRGLGSSINQIEDRHLVEKPHQARKLWELHMVVFRIVFEDDDFNESFTYSDEELNEVRVFGFWHRFFLVIAVRRYSFLTRFDCF